MGMINLSMHLRGGRSYVTNLIQILCALSLVPEDTKIDGITHFPNKQINLLFSKFQNSINKDYIAEESAFNNVVFLLPFDKKIWNIMR